MTRFALVKNESTAADIAQAFVEHVWNSHEMPLQITTDRGTEFTNAFSKSLCNIIGTRHTKSTSYYPQTDGQTERMNRVLEDMLRHYITPKMYKWDDMLPVLEFAINNSYQDSIKDTPFYANYGKYLCVPDDIKREGNPVETLRHMISLAILRRRYSRQKSALTMRSIVRKNSMMQDTENCSSKLVTKYG